MNGLFINSSQESFIYNAGVLLEKMVKQKKIVIIRGLVTAGKSTTSYELAKVLPGWIFIDAWKIKEMFEPLNLKDRTPLKTASKKAMITIMKEVMTSLGINILAQETSRSYLMKHLRDYLSKYNYKIYSFFLDVEYKDVIKRDIQREKPTMFKRGLSEKTWKKGRVRPEKGDVIINTSRHNTKEVIDMILKTIGEKRRNHPRAQWIRKAW